MTVLYNTTPASRIMYNTVLLYNTVFIIIMYYQTLVELGCRPSEGCDDEDMAS